MISDVTMKYIFSTCKWRVTPQKMTNVIFANSVHFGVNIWEDIFSLFQQGFRWPISCFVINLLLVILTQLQNTVKIHLILKYSCFLSGIFCQKIKVNRRKKKNPLTEVFLSLRELELPTDSPVFSLCFSTEAGFSQLCIFCKRPPTPTNTNRSLYLINFKPFGEWEIRQKELETPQHIKPIFFLSEFAISKRQENLWESNKMAWFVTSKACLKEMGFSCICTLQWGFNFCSKQKIIAFLKSHIFFAESPSLLVLVVWLQRSFSVVLCKWLPCLKRHH